MTLDKLYDLVKVKKFPIHTRDEVEQVIGNNKIKFEGHVYNARDIAFQIEHYPITSPAKFVKLFIEGYEEYSEREAELLHDMFEQART